MSDDEVAPVHPADAGSRPASVEKAERDRRQERAKEMWLDGRSFSAIGEALGTSKTTAYNDVQAAVAGVQFEPELERKRDILRIERMIQGISTRANAGDDFAIDRLAGKLLPLRAKLLGTLAPEKHELLGPEIVLRVVGGEVRPAAQVGVRPEQGELSETVVDQPCSPCGDTGLIEGRPCEACFGRKRHPTPETKEPGA